MFVQSSLYPYNIFSAHTQKGSQNVNNEKEPKALFLKTTSVEFFCKPLACRPNDKVVTRLEFH